MRGQGGIILLFLLACDFTVPITFLTMGALDWQPLHLARLGHVLPDIWKTTAYSSTRCSIVKQKRCGTQQAPRGCVRIEVRARSGCNPSDRGRCHDCHTVTSAGDEGKSHLRHYDMCTTKQKCYVFVEIVSAVPSVA
jgi:hypothetical protein